MKLAAKVLTILWIIGTWWTIVNLVLGILALKKIKAGEKSLGLSIVNIIFGNIGGIFMLLIK